MPDRGMLFIDHALAEQHCGIAAHFLHRYDTKQTIVWHQILDLMLQGQQDEATALAADALVELAAGGKGRKQL